MESGLWQWQYTGIDRWESLLNLAVAFLVLGKSDSSLFDKHTTKKMAPHFVFIKCHTANVFLTCSNLDDESNGKDAAITDSLARSCCAPQHWSTLCFTIHLLWIDNLYHTITSCTFYYEFTFFCVGFSFPPLGSTHSLSLWQLTAVFWTTCPRFGYL